MRALMIIIVVLVFGVNNLTAQETVDETLYGKPSDTRVEYSQLSFLRGDWDIDMVQLNSEGKRFPIENQAHLTAYYHGDGKTVQTCFTAPNFYSTDIRGFNEADGIWYVHFLNSNAQRFSHLTISVADGKVVTNVPGGFSGKENWDDRSIGRDITDAGFVVDVFRSHDEGVTWAQTYEMTYSRAKNTTTKRINC